MTYILGLSAFYHDSAAALLADDEIVAAVQEERFTREKYDPRFPRKAIESCLAEAGIAADRLDHVAFYEQPLTKFERLIETYTAHAPAGFSSFRRAIPVWLRQKLHLPREIRAGLDGLYKGRIFYPSHHESHAASAFFPSPFDEAAILTLDGVGEWATTTIGRGEGNRVELTEEIRFPHSLGLLYSAFTYYCGFRVNSGEYKLMGLAPYGEPRYAPLILGKLIDLKPDGSFHMDSSYFTYAHGLTMTGARFADLFGGPPRRPDSRLEQRHMDIAASIQRVCEEAMARTARHAWEAAGRPRNLVMAGGVALNCVANGKLLREGPFENIWIQPASGDAGGALGAALFVRHQILGKPRHANGRDAMKGSLLGPRFTAAEVKSFLDSVRARYRSFDDEGALLNRVAGAIAEGKIVGWFHGRAEFGPRALGARSIIGDPRSRTLQADLNLKIKFRESFRPFAPCVLREHVHEWFDMRPDEDSPYMLLVAPVLASRRASLSDEQRVVLRHDPDLSKRVNIARSEVPAVTHVDDSARVQTIDERHGRFQRLLQAFYARTGCPILVNTSFNLSWEPIVLSPGDAYHAFMQSEMDLLVLEDFVLSKSEQSLGIRPWAKPSRDDQAEPDSPWADPLTGDPLIVSEERALNPLNGVRYAVEKGIPLLFVPTADVADGHKKMLAPGYDALENPRALLEECRGDLFMRLLNEQIPFDARVVELGCGSGRLTNFLAIAHRSLVGVDPDLDALRLAQQFKTDHGIGRATFAQMNLSRPALRDGFFDFVLGNDPSRHAIDRKDAFGRVCRLANPGGYLVLRLYNPYARPFRTSGEHAHTLNEVLGWMEENQLDYVNSIPKTEVGPAITAAERLFEPKDPGTRLSRVVSELAHTVRSAGDGGTFLMIGRRRGTSSP